MGRSQSKLRQPNNPIEAEQFKAINKQRKLKKLQQEKDVKQRIPKKNKKRKLNMMPPQQEPPPPAVVIPQSLTKTEYDQLAVDVMRRQLQFKFSSFILNQLVLSFQFYGNFEREMLSAHERCAALEQEMNKKLQTYSVILPNVLDEALDQHVRFQKKHGPTKDQIMKLHTQTLYIIFENVQISKPKDENYDVVSRSRQICRVFIDSENTKALSERNKFFKGYVRLKYGQAMRNRASIKNFDAIRRIPNVSEQTTFHARENAHDQLTTPVEESEGYSYIGSRNSVNSYTNSSEATYDYTYITSLNTHQSLGQLNREGFSSVVGSSVLPAECISTVFITSENAPDPKSDDDTKDDESETESEDEFEDQAPSEYLEVRYLNSKAFLRYVEALLEEELAGKINLTKDDLKVATWKGASFFTPRYEIVPALYFPHWPECAFEWELRKRNARINPLTGNYLVWPTPEMIKHVVSLGCHAIPLGYASKKYKNTTRDLEWKIVFPEADKYLESKLSNTQVKVYMLCKALYKTYVEPLEKNEIDMFSLEHLRAHLFLSCEENYVAWPEQFLGDVLLKFLKSFLNRLSMKVLPDYFMPERNLFESIPESYMVRLYQTISQIVQNPVMHVIMAYRNLNLDDKFYPKLNYKKLYDCLIDDPIDVIKREATGITVSGSLAANMNIQRQESIKNDVDDEEDQAEGLIGYANKREMADRSKRRKTKLLKLKMQKKLEAEMKRRASEESIDLEFMIKDHHGPTKSDLRSTPDEVRRALVIDVFINSFVSMAKEAYKMKIFDQYKIYLNQNRGLCALLGEYGYENQSRKYLEKIELMERILETKKLPETTTGPALPSRLNLEPVRSFQKNKTSTNASNNFDEIFSDTKPATPTKVVQFKDGFNFIEPRSFYGEDTRKEKVKLNGILKQSGSSASHSKEAAAAIGHITNEEKSEDNNSLNCTEL